MANDVCAKELPPAIKACVESLSAAQFNAADMVIHDDLLRVGTVEYAQEQIQRAYQQVEVAHRAFFDALAREVDEFLDAQAKEG